MAFYNLCTMMSLPDLSNIQNIDQLNTENERLVSQGDKMLKATGVLDILGKGLAPPTIYGSYSYKLMVYPDIDCDIVSENVSQELVAQIAAKLIETDFVRKISVVNTVHTPSRRKGIPKGFWIGIDIPFEGDRWGIDCWYQKPEWRTQTIRPYSDELQHISAEQKDAILLIKHWLIINGLYDKKSYTSVDVYDAVLDKNVTSVEAFKVLHSL